MTTTTITMLHCDFPGCDEQAVERTADDWTTAIYTHGCPEHGAAIAEHKASVGCETYKRKDWWSLRCACGWAPRPARVTWSSRVLLEKHLAHVAEALAPWEPATEQPEPDDGDQEWRAWLVKSGRDLRERPVCCDLHGRNCEQGGEECCEHCTEAHHFAPGHGGVPCSAPDLSAGWTLDNLERPRPVVDVDLPAMPEGSDRA